MTAIFFNFVTLFVPIFNGLLLARIILSYFVKPTNRLYLVLMSITEPLLGPVRRLLPATPGLDWAPLVVFFGLQIIQMVLAGLLGG